MTIQAFLIVSSYTPERVDVAEVPRGLSMLSSHGRDPGNAFAAYEESPIRHRKVRQTLLDINPPEEIVESGEQQALEPPSWFTSVLRGVLGVATTGLSGLVQTGMERAVGQTARYSGQGRDCTKAQSMSECQRRSAFEAYSGDTTMACWEKWHSQLDRLDGLVRFKGKYAQLPVMQKLRNKWETTGPCDAARAAYDDWKRTDSYLRFMDAVTAELKENGHYQRLVDQRFAINKKEGRYEIDVRLTSLIYPDKDRAWVEARMRAFLTDWDQFRDQSLESQVYGKKLILQRLLEGELKASAKTS